MKKDDRSFGMYLVLTILTCGIYGIYFWYMMTEDLNAMCYGDGEDSPNYIVVILLSIITCGIYQFYWLYKQGNRIQNKLQANGIRCDESGTTLILWKLIGTAVCGIGALLADYFFIRNMNRLAADYNNYVARNGY